MTGSHLNQVPLATKPRRVGPKKGGIDPETEIENPVKGAQVEIETAEHAGAAENDEIEAGREMTDSMIDGEMTAIGIVTEIGRAHV